MTSIVSLFQIESESGRYQKFLPIISLFMLLIAEVVKFILNYFSLLQEISLLPHLQQAHPAWPHLRLYLPAQAICSVITRWIFTRRASPYYL